jgi:hypothetical protein
VSFQIPEISRLAMPRRGGALLDVKLLIFQSTSGSAFAGIELIFGLTRIKTQQCHDVWPFSCSCTICTPTLG